MDMTIKRELNQAAQADLYSNIEVIDYGAVVVDGTLLDLRGARSGWTVTLETDFEDSITEIRHCILNRDPDGVVTCIISEKHTAAHSESTSVVSAYPHTVKGTASQAISQTHPNSITFTQGIRNAYRAAHNQFLAWGSGLDMLGRYQPQEVVNAGHDWLLWGGFWAAYVIAHDDNLTWVQKVSWAEEVVKGAADVTTPAEFYEKPVSHTAPTGLVTWYDPVSSTRKELADAVTLSGTRPTTTEFANGAWIDSLNV